MQLICMRTSSISVLIYCSHPAFTPVSFVRRSPVVRLVAQSARPPAVVSALMYGPGRSTMKIPAFSAAAKMGCSARESSKETTVGDGFDRP